MHNSHQIGQIHDLRFIKMQILDTKVLRALSLLGYDPLKKFYLPRSRICQLETIYPKSLHY